MFLSFSFKDCQNNLFNELKSLMVEPTEEMVVSAAECCLRPATDSTAERYSTYSASYPGAFLIDKNIGVDPVAYYLYISLD